MLSPGCIPSAVSGQPKPASSLGNPISLGYDKQNLQDPPLLNLTPRFCSQNETLFSSRQGRLQLPGPRLNIVEREPEGSKVKEETDIEYTPLKEELE